MYAQDARDLPDGAAGRQNDSGDDLNIVDSTMKQVSMQVMRRVREQSNMKRRQSVVSKISV